MLRGMSTYVYVERRLHPGLLEMLARGGAQCIEVFCARQHFDYRSREQVSELGRWFRENPQTLHSLHSPMYSDFEWGAAGSPPVNLVDTEKRRRIDAMDEVKRAIEVAEQAPFRFLVQHLGSGNEAYEEAKLEYAITAVEHLRAFARPLGVTVLLENIPNEISTPEKLLEILRVGHFQDVGICFDTGHAQVMNSVRADFELLRDRIRSTHVHDNDGEDDLHLWPGDGKIDWPEATGLIAAAPQAPPWLMEIHGEEGMDVPGKMAEAYGRMEKALSQARERGTREQETR